MHRLPIFFFLCLILPSIHAQVNIRGVLKESNETYRAGDTLIFTSAREVGIDKQLNYNIKSSNNLLPANQIDLLLNDLNFWEIQQFYYSNYKIETEGWQLSIRKELEKKTLNLLGKLDSENLLYKDIYVEDYLQRLIQKIHYPIISKGRNQYIIARILNSEEQTCYAFDNGTILISTQLIANAESERQLFIILAEAVGHILLNSNLQNIENDSDSEYKQLGAIYPQSRQKRIRLVAEKYVNYYEKRTPQESYSSQFEFFSSIAGIISYTAWQEYYSQHYFKARGRISKLVEYGIANSTDYLLNAKIFLKITNTDETNKKALEYLQRAAEFKDQPLPEIYSEMGVIFLRERQFAKAKESFKKYHEMVVAKKDEEAEKWALKMINLCDIFDSKFNPADNVDLMNIEIIEE